MPGFHVCIVDDNIYAAESLAMLFRQHGFTASTANDSVSALELVVRERPILAILDIGLRDGTNGYELASRIRAKLGRSIRLFALTGRNGSEDLQAAAEAGFDRHFMKPADTVELLALAKEDSGCR
jgi:DNA-binding response OmpR family regulator